MFKLLLYRILLGIFCLIPTLSYGQVKFSGNLNLSTDFSLPNDTSWTHMYHLGFTPHLKMKDWTLGTSFFLHGNEEDYSDFSPTYFLDYRSNLNIRLRYKRTFDAQIGRISSKTGGILKSNVPIFGCAMTISPKKLNFSLSYGLGEPAVEEDTLTNIKSRYLRSFYAIQLKYGVARKSFVEFNLLYVKDHKNSVQEQGQLSPKSSFAAGLDWKLNLTKILYTKSEWAYSFYTGDLLMEEGKVEVNTNAFVLNGSTSLGYAGNFGIGVRDKQYHFEVGGKYFSPTYKSLGTSFQQVDYLDVKMSGSIRLWKKRIYASMSNGVRINQIVGNRLLGTKSLRLINNFSVQVRPIQKFSISASYSNYDIRLEDDSTRYYHNYYQNEIDTTHGSYTKSISNNFSLTPQISLGKKNVHTIWGTYNLSRNIDHSDNLTGQATSNNFVMGYSFLSRRFSVGTDAGYLSFSRKKVRVLNTFHLRPWIKLVLFKRKLSLNTSLLAESNWDEKFEDLLLKFGFSLQYKPIRKVRLKVDLHQNHVRDTPTRKSRSDQSFRIRTSLNITL